jgi:hypothetical protein
MRKAITLTLSVALLGIFAAVVVAAVGSSTDDRASTVPTMTTETEPTTTAEGRQRQTGVDISGPCDEAEHANDPRCTGVQAPPLPAGDGVDVSGPCDEAEHANDPRCTGAGGAGRLDNSGPGSMGSGRGLDDHGRDDDFDDHGRDDDFDDHGRGDDFDDFDDDGRDDHGGGGDSSGSGDDDDDSSGSGHGGDDDSGRGGGDDD